MLILLQPGGELRYLDGLQPLNGRFDFGNRAHARHITFLSGDQQAPAMNDLGLRRATEGARWPQSRRHNRETAPLSGNHHSQLPGGPAQSRPAAGGGPADHARMVGHPAARLSTLRLPVRPRRSRAWRPSGRGQSVGFAGRHSHPSGIGRGGPACPPNRHRRTHPARAAVDASHIALATAHGMDYLLTWNCRHIHNVTIIRQVERLCEKLGYTCPIICTPADLLES